MNSLDLYLTDTEIELLAQKTVRNITIHCYNTSKSNSYDNDYMIVSQVQNTCKEIMYAYFADLTDMFFYYDFIK